MIFLMCFLMAFGLGRCLDQLPSRYEIESSINRTISEVERLIKIDPSLPQLTRAQIVDILYNITSNDMDSLEKSVENTKLDYQRALTVVLPYNTKDVKNEDIKNLYTKPPMIQVIPDTETMLPYASIQEEPAFSPAPITENLITTKYSNEVKNQSINNKNEYKNHRATYDEPAKVDSTPLKFDLDFNNFNLPEATWPTTKSISKLINSDSDNKSTDKPKLKIIYSTSVTDKPTTKMMKTTTSRSPVEFRPTMPTTKSTVNVLSSDQWKYFAPPSTTTSTTRTTTTFVTTEKSSTTTRASPTITKRFQKPSPFYRKPQPFLPTVISTSSAWPTHPTPVYRKKPESSSKAPEVVAFNMADIKVMNDESTPMLFVTPMSSKPSEKILSSASTVNLTDKVTQNTSVTSAPMRNDVVTLLASIGLKPTEKKTSGDALSSNEINLISEQGIFATNFEIPTTNYTLPTQTSTLTANKVDSPSIINQNTFDNVHKNVQKGVDNLSSDVQLLFQRFGLQTSESDRTSTTKAPIRFSYKTNSWNNFKPLPNSEIRDAGMKDFLAKFGLGTTENRNPKSMKKMQEYSVIDAVPSSMKNILENIGLIIRPKVPRNIQIKTTTTTTTTSTTENPAKIHVFKPHEVHIGDPQQRLKINELLDTVKLVQEGEADVSDVRKIANDLLNTTKTLQNGPNPLSLEEILRIYNDDVKNEVKREEPKSNLSNDTSTTSNSDSPESSSTVKAEISSDNSSKNSQDSSGSADISANNSDGRIITSSVTTITTEASPSTEDSNIDALVDSFGGSTTAPDPVLPTPKKSGLYFLVDWNSFLEVGTDDDEKVNLRFAPKVGDRTRFIPVVVP